MIDRISGFLMPILVLALVLAPSLPVLAEAGALQGLDSDGKQKPSGVIEYKVKSGDYLIKICRMTLNAENLWRKVAEYNQLANPSLIFPGQIIRIPVAWFNGAAAEINDQVNTKPSDPGSGQTKPPAVNPDPVPPVVSGNAPNLPAPSFNKSEVTAGSPSFKGWVKNAVQKADSNKVPDLKDKYGNAISKEHIINAIVMIESSGYHTRNGKVVENAWGFTGFMQLSKGFGEGRFDPAKNLSIGAKYLLETCMKSASPPPGPNSVHNPADSMAERLVKAAAGYNRGPYATTKNIGKKLGSGEKALEHPWKDVVKSVAPKGKTYMHEGVYYGIKFKASLGLDMTRDEREWVKSYLGYGDSQLDSWANKLYSNVRKI